MSSTSIPTKVEGDRIAGAMDKAAEMVRRHRDDRNDGMPRSKSDILDDKSKSKRMNIKIKPGHLQKLADNKHLFSGINIAFEGDEILMFIPEGFIQVKPGSEIEMLTIMACIPVMHSPFIFLSDNSRGILGFSYASDLPGFIHRDGYELVSISGVQQTIYTLKRGKDTIYLTSRTLTGILMSSR